MFVSPRGGIDCKANKVYSGKLLSMVKIFYTIKYMAKKKLVFDCTI